METIIEIPFLDLLYRFAISLIIGFLIGLQREYASLKENETDVMFGGIRTFTLVGVLGCTAAYLSGLSGSIWPMLTVLAVLAILLSVSYHHSFRQGNSGLTSEVAAILTFIIGALCLYGEIVMAAILGVTMAVLLALKAQTQLLAKSVSREDIYATLQFAVISVIILPILPNTGIAPAPFDVLVPRNIWLMVVFISGISFLGYILIKFVGTKRAVGLTGILGGLASSTAVTLTFSHKSKEETGLAKPFAYAILLSWCIMFIRVLVEVMAINPDLLSHLAVPIGVSFVVCLGYAGWLYYNKTAKAEETTAQFRNPFRLGPVILFGLLYAVILLGAKLAQTYLGDTGVYVSSIFSGLVDVDAITLSMSELSKGDSGLSHTTASRAIVLAAISNTIVKGSIVLFTGSTALRKVIFPGLILIAITTLSVLFLLY